MINSNTSKDTRSYPSLTNTHLKKSINEIERIPEKCSVRYKCVCPISK